MNPFHQLGPGVMPRRSALLVLVEHLDVEQREVAWSLAVSRARPAKGDDLVPVLGSWCEASMVDDEVLLGPRDESCESLEKFICLSSFGCDQEMLV